MLAYPWEFICSLEHMTHCHTYSSIYHRYLDQVVDRLYQKRVDLWWELCRDPECTTELKECEAGVCPQR